MTRAARVLATLVLLAGALALTPDARAQRNQFDAPPAQQVVSIPAGGTELFRALLDREGIQPVSLRDIQNRNVWPTDDLIVISIGSQQQWPNDPLDWVRSTVAANGGALIATDSQTPVYRRDMPPNFGNNPVADFNGNTVSANFQECHRQETMCPYATPVSPDELRIEKPGPVWGLFRGLTKLATNQPSYIEMRNNRFGGEYAYPLARLPRSSTVWGQNFPQPLLAVGGDGEPQRWNNDRPGYSFLAVADSSIYINQMLMEPGTSNLEFAMNTVEYLQGPQKHRKKCVFFENGKVIEKFDGLRSALAKPRPKIPPEAMPSVPSVLGRNQERLVEMANGMADQFQTKDGLHNILVGPTGSDRERRSFGKWIDVVAILASIAIILFLLRRVLQSRQPLDVPSPPNTGAGAASTGPPGVFDRRQKELVRRNNLYEPVRNLMREFFDAVGAPPNPGPRIPTLEISDAVRKPESLRQAIRDMWRIAYGPPQPISAQRWFELEPYFDRLRKAHADGKWRFVTDE